MTSRMGSTASFGLAVGMAMLAMCLVRSPALAQDLGIKAPPQGKPVAITNAVIHTLAGSEIEKGTIVFEQGLIKKIYTSKEWDEFIALSKTNWGAWDVIDAAGKHVYPGLIAADTQLGLQEFGLVVQTNDHSELGSIKPETLSVTAVNPDSTLLPVTRSNGIMTAGVFPEGGTIPGRVCVIRLDGWTTEELAIAPTSAMAPGAPDGAKGAGGTGAGGKNGVDHAARPNPAVGLSVSWPQSRTFRAWWMDQSEEDQQKANREQLERVTRVFDAASAYIAAKAADPNHPTDLRWEAMRDVLAPAEAGARGRLPVFIAANDYDQIVSAVAFCDERHLKMVLVGGREADLAAEMLKARDISVIISGTHTTPRRNDSAYDEAYTLPARLSQAGVRYCIASADRTAHERNLPYNAAMAVAHGLSMDDAIKSVTLWPAQILGLGDQLGSLEPGKRATLIVTSGNPLDVTTRIDSAYIDGRKIDLSNKQSKLYEKYRERFKQMGQIKGP